MNQRALELGLVALGLVLVLAAQSFLDGYQLSIVTQALEYTLLGLGLNLIFGFAGRGSFGHSGFFGVGAYTFALLQAKADWGPLPSAAAGIGFAVVIGGLIGVPMLRLRGHYLALGTLAFGFVVLSTVQQSYYLTGGSDGLLVPTIIPRTSTVFIVLTVIAAAVLYLTLRVAATRFGRALVAIREDEDAARSLGVAVERYVWYAFVASAAVVAIAGVIRVAESALVAPERIDLRLNIQMLVLIVLGGMGNAFGIAVAAFFLATLPHLLLGFERYENLVYGAILLFVLLVSPRGLGLWVSTQVRELFTRGPAPPPTAAGPRATPPRRADGSARVRETLSISVSGLKKRFGGVVALNGVDLAVQGGEILAVIGPNGAGKTTLVNVLSGLLRPDSGSIVIDGVEVAGRSSVEMVRAGVVRTFQLNRVFEEMTVHENLLVGRHLRSALSLAEFLWPFDPADEVRQRAKADEILEIIGLEWARTRLAGQLSYGQKRMLELGRALAAEPRLLLLDEPAAGLHPDRIAELHHHIAGVAARGAAVLLIEHRMPLVKSVSTRIAVLNEGRNLVTGAPDEVLSNAQVREAYLGHAFATRR